MKKYKVKYFIDNKVKQGEHETFLNFTVLNPNDIDMADHTDIFLMSVHFISMWKQLMEIGVSPQRLAFPYYEKPYFESDDALDFYVEKMEFEKDKIICLSKSEEKSCIVTQEDWTGFLCKAYKSRYPLITAIASMETIPISKQFATERGTPVDRYYIEQFLKEHNELIKGDVLEIEDSTYTKMFGKKERLNHVLVMDVSADTEKITFNANLETGEGIRRQVADCFICTQTLMYIFDIKEAAKNIGRLLKTGGYALITCSGLSQNSRRCMDNYGCCFNFNAAVFEKMFEDEDSLSVVETGSYGNVKTVLAHLAGLCQEDLKKEDFEPNDIYYPLIVYAVVKKIG